MLDGMLIYHPFCRFHYCVYKQSPLEVLLQSFVDDFTNGFSTLPVFVFGSAYSFAFDIPSGKQPHNELERSTIHGKTPEISMAMASIVKLRYPNNIQ